MSAPIRNLIFDLDGTLSDPMEGFVRSVGHALVALGRPVHTEEIARWIGPPLRSMFTSLLESDDSVLIERAVAAYRSRYFDVGLFENRLYDGVAEALAALHAEGFRLFVATSKVRVAADRIVEHFGITPFFTRIYGSELDGRFDDKCELLQHLMNEQEIGPSGCVMIGDRMHDMLAAKACGCRSIGVTYGYGSREELLAHGADALCERPEDLRATVDGMANGRYRTS